MLALSVPPAEAALITIEITAEVDSVRDEANYLEGKISPGDIITGSYTYESSTQDSSPIISVGDYWHYAPPCGISLGVGGFMFSTDPANIEFLVEIINDHPPFSSINRDAYLLRSYNNLPLSNGTLVYDISWHLNDSTATALSSDALPTTPPILDDWSQSGLYISGGFGTEIDPITSRPPVFVFEAHVTSAIPEPATILLLTLGGLLLRKRSS